MATLMESDIEKLFSGAPQYFARSAGQYTGAPNPLVAFPWDEALAIRDLTDHIQIEDKAWGCVTAWPHITRDVLGRPSTGKKRRPHFQPRCRERPNMLSMGGLEKGSVGYQAALEMAVADALQEEQWGFENLGSQTPAIVEQRQRMLTSQEGLRYLDETAILEQLLKNGNRYGEEHARTRRESTDLYNELFIQILHPPTKVIDHNDPYSLSVQIQALVKVLATPNAWIDFSHVEWRIRLGQLLWGYPDEDDEDEGASLATGDDATEIQEERYWLLLQILLACELLIRLDAITEGDETGAEIKRSEMLRFERDATPSVKWSLHLARVWLENIEVIKNENDTLQVEEQKPAGWLATLTKRMSFSSQDLDSEHLPRPAAATYAMKGKYSARQVDGLAHFARKLRWPDIESYANRISENIRLVAEGTPFTTPLASPTPRNASRRSSYFGGGSKDTVNTGSLKRTPSRRQNLSAALRPSGWLSKSYVSGLMLPGEGLYHFLMSTLLENDQNAMAKLGPMANLCGGFVYHGKSFWSTACIVGRVLAAGKGSAECMGWISSDIMPEGLGDGWVNVEVADSLADARNINKKARLWGKQAIERESDVLGNADPSSVLPADFIIPFENNYKEQPPAPVKIALKSLGLFAHTDSVHSTPSVEEPGGTPFSEFSRLPEIRNYTATVSFTVTTIETGEEKENRYSLSHDIYFVTAHPCVPSQHVKILKSPSSPTIQHVDISGGGTAGKTVSVVGHPLHKYYTYTTIHLADLLAKHDFTLEALLGNYDTTAHRPTLTPASANKGARVLVIDCITGFQPMPQEHEIPLSPVTSRSDSRSPLRRESSSASGPLINVTNNDGTGGTTAEEATLAGAIESAAKKMHPETRRRQFGSDIEIIVRAFCAEKGWNALISRRRRGCLACAIREAGALGWKIIIRVD
ncbi:hypothetical protein GQ53DRAFT_446545 [Thozetella sp. PMI_491]|nr:hypothetical protein GQ53DRAFT_446545 [Thozetella sp. PMI_491]